MADVTTTTITKNPIGTVIGYALGVLMLAGAIYFGGKAWKASQK